MLPLSPFHQPTNWTRFLFVSLGSAVALYAGGCTGAKQQMRPGGVDPSISQLFITFTPKFKIIQSPHPGYSWFIICFSHVFQAFSRRLPSTIPSTSTGEALPRGCRRCGSGPSPPFRSRCSAEISTFRRCWMSWSAAAAALDVTRGN